MQGARHCHISAHLRRLPNSIIIAARIVSWYCPTTIYVRDARLHDMAAAGGILFLRCFLDESAIMLASTEHSSCAFAALDFFCFALLALVGTAVHECVSFVLTTMPRASKRGERSALRTALCAQLKMTRPGQAETVRRPFAPFFSAFTCSPGLRLSIAAFTKLKSSFPAHLEQ